MATDGAEATFEQRIPAGDAIALEVEAGNHLRIEDVAGEQVATVVCYSRADPTEHLELSFSYSQSRDADSPLELFSDEGNRMMAAVEDTAGTHDFRNDMCTDGELERRFGVEGGPSCHSNLTAALSAYDVPDWLPWGFGVFKSVDDTPPDVEMGRAASEPGDYLELTADMDLIVAVSACPHRWDVRNSYNPTPIDVTVTDHGQGDQ